MARTPADGRPTPRDSSEIPGGPAAWPRNEPSKRIGCGTRVGANRRWPLADLADPAKPKGTAYASGAKSDPRIRIDPPASPASPPISARRFPRWLVGDRGRPRAASPALRDPPAEFLDRDGESMEVGSDALDLPPSEGDLLPSGRRQVRYRASRQAGDNRRLEAGGLPGHRRVPRAGNSAQRRQHVAAVDDSDAGLSQHRSRKQLWGQAGRDDKPLGSGRLSPVAFANSGRLDSRALTMAGV